MPKVECGTPNGAVSDTNYHLEVDELETTINQFLPQPFQDRESLNSDGGNPRQSSSRRNSLNGNNHVINLGNEEEPRNIISLRYRADSMADSIISEKNEGAEAKVWNMFEHIFCFLKGMTIYQTRKRLKFIIFSQAALNTSRIVPIILGLSYRTTVPVFFLFVTLVLGWHGTKFLVPKFLLFYKIGMQFSLLIDIIWYLKGYNGNLTSVRRGTSLLMQGFFSILLTFLNVAGLLYGWKLRRIVKSIQDQREYDRAAIATMIPPTPPRGSEYRIASFNHLRNTLSMNNNLMDQDNNFTDGSNPNKRLIEVGKRCEEATMPRKPSRVLSTSRGVNDRNAAKAKKKCAKKAKDRASMFCSNMIRTNKYTLYNFPFVFLKLQFSRLANFYTTIVVVLCFFNFSPVSPIASLTPLLIVFASSAIKDFSEDLRRKKADRKVNSKPCHIVRFNETTGSATHIQAQWKDILVGDFLILTDGDDVPADCVLLSTSRLDGRCYVETSNLDGETNLKIRSVASCTKHLSTVENILEKYSLEVECDLPNKDLFYFDGVLKLSKKHLDSVHEEEMDQVPQAVAMTVDDVSLAADTLSASVSNVSDNSGPLTLDALGAATKNEPLTNAGNLNQVEEKTSLNMDNLILRGSQSRNSEWTIGLVIYTGKETKVALNSSEVPLKRSYVERTLDTMFVLVMLLLFSISVACSLGNNGWNFEVSEDKVPWYMNGSKENEYIFLSYVILFNNLIPLSMYVTMEGVRFVHARYIENDLEMYDEATDTPAEVRNSNINEDLGQIQYIFSDKTGTLTRNEMVFAKCTIAGLRYNDMETDIGTPQRPGTRFNDPRLIARLNSNHTTKKEIHDFLLLLTICNTVIPEMYPLQDGSNNTHESPTIHYQAASPDEEALVLAASDLGYVLLSRDGPLCNVLIQGKPMTVEILHVLEFNSDRKRMSVIFRLPNGRIKLYCKGADDIIFELLSKSQPQGVSHVTRGHLQEYASQGLRTLTAAMRDLAQAEYQAWAVQFREAELSLEQRAAKVARVSALIEVDLTLLGATAIEDRLQDGVEECICALRKAGMKFWVLTGDKKETALSIGMSSQVIDDNMDVIVLNQRDKTVLRAKLEELYVDLVDDKWGSDENASVWSVIYEAFRRAMKLGWKTCKCALIGRDQKAKKKKKRRHHLLHLATDELALQRENTVMSSISEEQMLSDVEVYPADSEAPAPFSSASSPPRPIGKDEEDVYSDQSGSECGDADRMLNRAALPPAKITRKASGTSSHARPPLERLVSEDESAPEEEEIEYAMVIDGKTLGLLLDDDIKYLFLAVATQCKSVICCRCSPAQKASVVKLVTEPTLMFSPGNISLAIGDGANDVPMIQAANVGIGISGKEGRQAVLSSDYSFAQFRFLKRLVLVHGNYSYKRISKLILFSFMKNVALSLSNFFFAVQTMYSGLLMYFSIFFTLYNALFTTIPIVVIAMYNQDVSPAVLMQYPSLYVNGLKNRSFNWMSFFGWCGLGVWHAYVIYFVPFTSDGFLRNYFMVSTSEEEVLLFNSLDLGLWADGVAAYTYLIVASTAQVSLMTSNWTRPNVLSTLGTLLFYFAFVAFFCNVYGWTGADIYETEVAYSVFNKLVVTPWFWFGMVLATVTAVVPNYFAKAGRVLFYPEPSHLMREWNRLCKQEDLGVQMTSPRLLRRHTGFAFSHCPGESSMALFKSPPKATRVSRTGNAQNNNTSTESISNSTTNPSPDNDVVISSPAINNHHHSLDTSRDVGIL